MRNVKEQLKGRDFDFVEIMACPSGCINGGGQLKPPAEVDAKVYTAQVETLYQNVSVKQSPTENAAVRELYDTWLKNDADSIVRHLHTQYHPVEQEETSLVVKW